MNSFYFIWWVRTTRAHVTRLGARSRHDHTLHTSRVTSWHNISKPEGPKVLTLQQVVVDAFTEDVVDVGGVLLLGGRRAGALEQLGVGVLRAIALVLR
jgi:hypothetical protein